MDSEQPKPATPSPEAEISSTEQTTAAVVEVQVGDSIATAAVVATTGKRQAFSNIRRQLSETDLSSPGVQKMLLEELDRAEAQCEIAEGFRERFHQADKEAAVLREKLKPMRALDIYFGLGLTIGGVMIGLAATFWNQNIVGEVFLAVGAVILLGSVLARLVKA